MPHACTHVHVHGGDDDVCCMGAGSQAVRHLPCVPFWVTTLPHGDVGGEPSGFRKILVDPEKCLAVSKMQRPALGNFNLENGKLKSAAQMQSIRMKDETCRHCELVVHWTSVETGSGLMMRSRSRQWTIRGRGLVNKSAALLSVGTCCTEMIFLS